MRMEWEIKMENGMIISTLQCIMQSVSTATLGVAQYDTTIQSIHQNEGAQHNYTTGSTCKITTTLNTSSHSAPIYS